MCLYDENSYAVDLYLQVTDPTQDTCEIMHIVRLPPPGNTSYGPDTDLP